MTTESNANKTQYGGDHYKKLGDFQPWNVLKAWLTPEEFRGFMKGSALVYLARERDKGGDLDIQKAEHFLAKLIEVINDGRDPGSESQSSSKENFR